MSENSHKYHVGVDIGGTFTDTIVIDDQGEVSIGKAPSTPPDFEQGFITSMGSAAERRGISLEEMLKGSHGLYHGCTVGTNALVERRTAKVGLLTTMGMRDTVFIMRAGHRLNGLPPEELAQPSHHRKPEQLLPKALIEEITERVAFDGNAVVELNEEETRVSIQRLIDAGVESFAVSLMGSIVNPAHELRVAELIREMSPNAFVSISSEVVRRRGEYERTVATVINALIGPVMSAYLGKLGDQLGGLGYDRTLWIMSCAGGVVDAKYARSLPLLTIDSGPVGGLIGSGALTRAGAAQNGGDDAAAVDVITTDMGGTTFDVGVIRSGEPLTSARRKYGQYDYFLPSLDVRAVGAGGGSLIRFDEASKALRVGPRSAGANPGPAAYQRGGTEPTVTDADLVVGYLNPDFFLGGELSLSVDAAREALERVGSALGLDADETAAAAVRIVDNQMADAIRLASVQQGYDPRTYTMYAYGGAGPVHGTALAASLGIERLVVPLSNLASGWSAFGVVSSDAVATEELSRAMSSPFDPEELAEGWRELDQRVTEIMSSQGIDPGSIELERTVDLRYTAQVNVMPIKAPAGAYDESSGEELIARFEAEYERVFGAGAGYPGAGYVITALRVVGRAPRTELSLARNEDEGVASGAEAAKKGERGVIFYESSGMERVQTPIYDGAKLTRGDCVSGPSVIEYVDTTVVVHAGQKAGVDGFGSLVVEL
jgi:N-methylhydantoinase A